MYPLLAVPGPGGLHNQGAVIPWLGEVRAHSATMPGSSPWAKEQEPAARGPGHRGWGWNPEQASAWAAATGPGVAALVGAGRGWGLSLSQK